MTVRRQAAATAKDEQRSLAPRFKLWLEQDGVLVMSEYRAELLRQVAATGSLAEAAQRMNLSYRRAWGKIREIERNFGVVLVESEAGGVGGGGSRLTPEGERLLALYDRFCEVMSSNLGREFRQVLKE